jgi:hypothetical protein
MILFSPVASGFGLHILTATLYLAFIIEGVQIPSLVDLKSLRGVFSAFLIRFTCAGGCTGDESSGLETRRVDADDWHDGAVYGLGCHDGVGLEMSGVRLFSFGIPPGHIFDLVR